ncbi:MAG: hypothetical protein GKC05_06850 [Methanomicrobiales archaeon]|nr:hypothetical protein [Methanomicrobiales archaeon]
MKKILIVLVTLIVLAGYAGADHTLPPVPETQGIVTSASINAVGNFASSTEIQWRITAEDDLTEIPPLETGIYESVYTEDTQSDGVGLVLYDKELDVETSGQISGQWNIEAIKQIAFVGIDGSAIVSGDVIMLDVAATADPQVTSALICPFAEQVSPVVPAHCNRAEAGSTIDMTVANVRTTTSDRFISPSGDHPAELNHDIRVTELVTDVPSVGMASAYLNVLIQEGGFVGGEGLDERPGQLMERIEFSEVSAADGAITLFEKLMHYESGMVR